MDWLVEHRITMNCFTREIVIDSPGQPRVVLHGDKQGLVSCLALAMEAAKLLQGGFEAYLAWV